MISDGLPGLVALVFSLNTECQYNATLARRKLVPNFASHRGLINESSLKTLFFLLRAKGLSTRRQSILAVRDIADNKKHKLKYVKEGALPALIAFLRDADVPLQEHSGGPAPPHGPRRHQAADHRARSTAADSQVLSVRGPRNQARLRVRARRHQRLARVPAGRGARRNISVPVGGDGHGDARVQRYCARVLASLFIKDAIKREPVAHQSTYPAATACTASSGAPADRQLGGPNNAIAHGRVGEQG